jgi:hypothetical protein
MTHNTGPWFLGQIETVTSLTPSPLDKQVGGDHYKGSKVQPIEVIRDWNLGFECGNAVKYIARHKKKGEPKKDIQKAIHYLEMYLENLKD